jgi:predicted DNA-binding transcriptional regulator YafY
MKPSKPTGISEKVIRLLEIYTLIAQKEYPSVGSLKERFCLSERTLYRYLELINMVDAIEYDPEKEGYKFTKGDRIKKLILSQDDLITLFSAGQAVSALGISFRENFQNLIQRMFITSGKPVPEEQSQIIIKTPDPVFTDKTEGMLKTISGSMSEKRSVEITYRSQRSKATGIRLVDPYGLIYYDGVWIMVGFCHLRKEIRSFAVDRILGIKERYLYFKPEADFDLKEHLSHSWGIIDGEKVQVIVRFGTAISEYILRKKKWHPSENRRLLPDGTVELTFTVAGTDEIKRWIYSWLPNVEVLEPESLRKQVQKELAESALTHSHS